MRFEKFSFGSIQIDGRTYEHDIIIDRGLIRKRHKKPSKKFHEQFGHTPLSVEEEIPWRYRRLVIGTGTYGRLPVIGELKDEAQRRKIELLLLANRGGYPRAAERAQRCQCRASLDVLARLNPWPNRPMCLSRCWYLVA